MLVRTCTCQLFLKVTGTDWLGKIIVHAGSETFDLIFKGGGGSHGDDGRGFAPGFEFVDVALADPESCGESALRPSVLFSDATDETPEVARVVDEHSHGTSP